jgi:molecular chaperone DnaK
MTKIDNSTITIGIDLGTTNSSIAVNVNGKIEIIKKPGGVGYTPSVFGFNKTGNKIVGQKAYEYLYKYGSKNEGRNFKAEIKRLMGTPETVFFERSKTKMTPEEISSEILKELKEDILRKYPDFDTVAAVITIPAAFSVLQSEATKKAGNLAGFKHVVLLQEPIAAAASYGFQNAENENWLIYDFGGGTFDIALISCKDGILSVLGHNGDNFLGGKNIDWDVVDTIIVPKILEKYQLTNFTRKNTKYQNTFSHLKYNAELAKIELSQYDKTTIEIEDIGKDDSGEEISLSIDISRSELEKLIKSTVDRTIELTKDTLKESGLKSESVKKLILVGGPTQMPYLKERLENDLKIQVDSSVDPLTVVAHGACIFAMSKKIPKEFLSNETKDIKGTNKITLNYSSLTSDTEESVTGIIEGLNDSEQYYIQIQSDSGTFTGAKTKIIKCKFYYSINIEPNKQNLFWVYVFDQKGNPVKISIDSFLITHGLSVSGAPIPHSINVVISKRDISSNIMTDICENILEKGSILPLKKTLDVYKTSRILKKGEDSSLDIDIVEGESEIPDRNTFVCTLGIKGQDLPYDLPEGTPVELTVEYTESRVVIVTAYVPLIDITLNVRRTEKDEVIDPKIISSELESQRHRAKETQDNCTVEESKKIDDIIDSVEKGAASTDEDDQRKAEKQLKDLKILLDKNNEEKAASKLTNEYNSRIESMQKTIQEYVNPEELDDITKQFEHIQSDGEMAIKSENKVMIIRINEQLDSLESKILFSNLSYCIEYFKYIVSLGENGNFTNEQDAKYCITKGITSIESEDIDELKRWTVELNNLLPSKAHPDTHSGLTR